MLQRTVCPNPNCQQALEVRSAPGQMVRCPRCQLEFRPSAPPAPPSGPRRSVGVAPSVRTVGRYQLGTALGAGTYGTVYRARDPRLEREVALKVLNNNRGEAREVIERFLREARSAARLHHPNIVTV